MTVRSITLILKDRKQSLASLTWSPFRAMLIQILINAFIVAPADIHSLIPGTRKYVGKLNLAERIEVQILK